MTVVVDIITVTAVIVFQFIKFLHNSLHPIPSHQEFSKAIASHPILCHHITSYGRLVFLYHYISSHLITHQNSSHISSHPFTHHMHLITFHRISSHLITSQFSHITSHHISSHLVSSNLTCHHISSHLITFHHKTSHHITHHISFHIFTSHATHPLVHTNDISYKYSIEYSNETLTPSEY